MPNKCSRPSRPGSIAALGRGACMARWSDGAPGLHGRAPLRRLCRQHPTGLGQPVLPAFTAGLHCGSGSAEAPNPRVSTSAPGLHGRAPLRRPGRPRKSGRARRVLPAFTAGLHCGTSSPISSCTGVWLCSRPSRPGSIAAPSTSTSWRLSESVLPAFTAGLHCGHRGRPSNIRSSGRCSRPSRPGSIAAAARASTSRRRRGGSAPGLHGRAPLRQRTLHPDRAVRMVCSRPSRPGSIAAAPR